jgi:hypothetical protein
MSWEQRKIMHYLLFKNWFIAKKEGEEIFKKHEKEKSALLWSLFGEMKEKMPHLPAEYVKTYIIETCFHYTPLQKYILKKTELSLVYQLRYDLFSIPVETKAAVFDRLVYALFPLANGKP